MTIDLYRLSLPFPRAAVHWRVQGTPYERNGAFSAMALAYLDARDVMDRLDDVCGADRWQSHFEETAKGRIICRISIDVNGNGNWVTKSDGAGNTDVEAEKGALSDALKRAAVSWGIGRYLYRLDSPWVACEVSKKGDKNYWKRWTEDPWAKVKDAPPEPSSAAIVEAVNAIARTANEAELQACWRNIYTGSRHVADHPVVYAAKEARKVDLAQKVAA